MLASEFEQAHVAEFLLAEPEIAKTERQIDIRVELREEPGGGTTMTQAIEQSADISHF